MDNPPLGYRTVIVYRTLQKPTNQRDSLFGPKPLDRSRSFPPLGNYARKFLEWPGEEREGDQGRREINFTVGKRGRGTRHEERAKGSWILEAKRRVCLAGGWCGIMLFRTYSSYKVLSVHRSMYFVRSTIRILRTLYTQDRVRVRRCEQTRISYIPRQPKYKSVSSYVCW